MGKPQRDWRKVTKQRICAERLCCAQTTQCARTILRHGNHIGHFCRRTQTIAVDECCDQQQFRIGAQIRVVQGRRHL